jgi:hypothetical protein
MAERKRVSKSISVAAGNLHSSKIQFRRASVYQRLSLLLAVSQALGRRSAHIADIYGTMMLDARAKFRSKKRAVRQTL